MVTKETNGAFLFGYLVGVAWKLLREKRRLWRLLHCSFILVSFAARKEKGDTCLDVGGAAPYFRAVEMRKAPSSPLASASHQCLALSPELPPGTMLTPAFAVHLQLAPCARLFPSLSPTRCPGTWNHWSPIPALPSEGSWRSNQLPSSPQLMAVTPQGHLPGTRPEPPVRVQNLLYPDVTVGPGKWVPETCWTGSRSQSWRMKSRHADPGLWDPRVWTPQVLCRAGLLTWWLSVS